METMTRGPPPAMIAGGLTKRGTVMSTSMARLSYYNGYMWHVVLLPGGTRAVWPSRLDGRPAPGAVTRYYRGPARMSHGEDRQPAIARAAA
jgi:hypothetical protein